MFPKSLFDPIVEDGNQLINLSYSVTSWSRNFRFTTVSYPSLQKPYFAAGVPSCGRAYFINLPGISLSRNRCHEASCSSKAFGWRNATTLKGSTSNDKSWHSRNATTNLAGTRQGLVFHLPCVACGQSVADLRANTLCQGIMSSFQHCWNTGIQHLHHPTWFFRLGSILLIRDASERHSAACAPARNIACVPAQKRATLAPPWAPPRVFCV